MSAAAPTPSAPKPSEPNTVDPTGTDEPRTGRRSVLGLAAAAAVAGAAAATVGGATPAFAATLNTGSVADTQQMPTGVRYNGVAVNGPGSLFLAAEPGQQGVTGFASSYPAALGGWSFASGMPHGVHGKATVSGGIGVVGEYTGTADSTSAGVKGRGNDAVGVLGSSSNSSGVVGTSSSTQPFTGGVFGAGAIGVIAEGDTSDGVLSVGARYGVAIASAGAASLWLNPANGVLGSNPKSAPAARSDHHEQGEIDIDGSGDLWFCVAAGTPGTWLKLAGATTGGAFHPITPTRVYDSRTDTGAIQHGPLAGGANRVVPIQDARPDGPVVTADVVPVGATAITFNLAIVDTVGAGFLSVNPGDVTTFTAATINWSANGQILNNGTVCKLDAQRRLMVFCGGAATASTQFVIDVTGYYR